MTRRSGKAPAQGSYSSASSATDEVVSTPQTHLRRHHLHLTNNIHVKNHLHMQRKDGRHRINLMLEPLRRELTAVKKVKSLQDPSTSWNCHSFISPGCSAYTSSAGGCHDDSYFRASHSGKQVSEKSKETRVRRQCHGAEEFADRLHARRSESCSGNNGHGDINLRRRDNSGTLAPRSGHHPNANYAARNSLVDERWHGDPTEIARRLIAEHEDVASCNPRMSPKHRPRSLTDMAGQITDLGVKPLTTTAITSRSYSCQKLKESEIVTRLQALVEKDQNLSVDPAALSLIASRADGSLRDAESMLEQLSLLEDQTITLSTVQELSGVIPDEKLLALLDMALAADTVNTVKGMRELLQAGIDALSLLAQLASLITNILAGTFKLQRRQTTHHKKGSFFHRNMPRGEEQQRLRQALKVLADCEKQLRAISTDRSTWLAAALLQFAPDKSYLPSSVDSSKAPSMIALIDTFEGDYQPSTPNLPPPQPPSRMKHYSQNRNQNVVKASRAPPPIGNQHLHATLRADNGLGHDYSSYRRIGNRDFRPLPHRDVERIWEKVLNECRSTVLPSHGSLVALSIASDEASAVAHVMFRSAQHKARAERIRSSTCHAFQMALGCPVQLKLEYSLGDESCPPRVVTALDDQELGNQADSSHEKRPCQFTCPAPHPQFDHATSHAQRHIVPPPRSSYRHEMQITGLAARSRRVARVGSGQRRRNLSSHANINDYKHCFPGAESSSTSRQYRSGRRRPISVRIRADRSSLGDHGRPVVKVRWKRPKCKGMTDHCRNRKLKHRHNRGPSGVYSLCWQSPSFSEQDQQSRNRLVPDQRSARKMGFFLRLVSCGRPNGSPIDE